MTDIELPFGNKRRPWYRFFEILPGILSYGAVIILIVLAIINPLFAAIYLLLVTTTVIVKAFGIAYHTIKGRNSVEQAQKENWTKMLQDLEDPVASDARLSRERASTESSFVKQHRRTIAAIAASAEPFPKPSEVYNAVIIATYKEPYEVLRDTIEVIKQTTYDNSRLMIVLAYEERGGKETVQTARRLKKIYGDVFGSFDTVMHPANMKNEVIGKGGNITYAGRYLKDKLDREGIAYSNVIVTTLDSDNRPHKSYFDYVTYDFIIHPNRKHLSFQPVSLFLNNIWDVPAPMRVVATGNSFWNIISAMRPHMLRNFASHAQPMDALVEMDFWSTHTIVEDGHQYWRSYFHFDGNYSVSPILVPIYQDAVMSDTYTKTLKAQFVQLRRWAYGASDVPYVATRIFTRKRTVPFFAGLTRFIRLVDGHVTLACIPVLITFGGYIPLLINSEATRSIAANQLPEVLGTIMRVALIGIIITVFLSYKMLPERPARYKRRRNVWMISQWVLMPVTALVYSSLSAYYSQTRLLLGKYLNVFDVTEKATAVSVRQAKQRKKLRFKRKFKLPLS